MAAFQQQLAPFDLVKQFDAMRQQGQGLSPTPQPVADIPDSPYTAPGASGGRMAPQGGFSGSTAATGAAPSRLVKYGAYQYDADVVPKIEGLLKAYPKLRPTSGYRDPDHNRRVGGVPNSRHLKGTAGDFVGSARDMAEAAGWARRMGAAEVLVHNAGSGQHLHVGW